MSRRLSNNRNRLAGYRFQCRANKSPPAPKFTGEPLCSCVFVARRIGRWFGTDCRRLRRRSLARAIAAVRRHPQENRRLRHSSIVIDRQD